jgi:putative ABC transport system ATP-binding protein
MSAASAPSDARPIVEASSVSRRFRSRSGAEVLALDGVSLSVARGQFVAITGPSGGGKSTLLAILSALDRPSEGRVVFDGEALDDASDAALTRIRRRVGLVFQQSPMLRRLSAWENVATPLVPRGVPEAERRARSLALLERVGLKDRIWSRTEELSGGELQRVGVARALVTDPEVVFADEPTSNLDRRSAEAVAALLVEMHDRGRSGRTVVVATHDPTLIDRATTTIELDGGRVRGSS